jgi:hypothetical protein
LYGACSPDDTKDIVIQVGKSKIFKRQEENSQCRLLFGGLLHPPGPSRNTCCRRQGLVGRWRGPRHGNSHRSGGGRACFHPFGLRHGWQSRETTSRYCQYAASLILSNSPKQQLSTWRNRLLAPCICALVSGPSAPVGGRRPTPRSGRRSCPDAVLLWLLRSPVSPRILWTRCCLEPQQVEPSWLQWQQKGGDDTLGGGPVAAGSCSTAPCDPAESYSVN